MTLGEKLDPRRFSSMSAKMAAIVAYILGEEAVHTTDPAIAELILTSDGVILARNEGDIGANDFIGSVEDFNRNWGLLVRVAELTPEEIEYVHVLIDRRITNFGRPLPTSDMIVVHLSRRNQ